MVAKLLFNNNYNKVAGQGCRARLMGKAAKLHAMVQ
jgi:hypothetical protein